MAIRDCGRSPRIGRLELDPARLDVRSGRDLPRGRLVLPGSGRAEEVRFLVSAAVIGPVKGHPGTVLPLRLIDQVGLTAGIVALAVVAEADAYRGDGLITEIKFSPAETLRPEVL